MTRHQALTALTVGLAAGALTAFLLAGWLEPDLPAPKEHHR